MTTQIQKAAKLFGGCLTGENIDCPECGDTSTKESNEDFRDEGGVTLLCTRCGYQFQLAGEV